MYVMSLFLFYQRDIIDIDEQITLSMHMHDKGITLGLVPSTYAICVSNRKLQKLDASKRQRSARQR